MVGDAKEARRDVEVERLMARIVENVCDAA
jgi:hypothetical protein